MPGFTFHDFRRSVATGLQRLGVRLEVTGVLLNDVSGSRRGIVGVYQRHRWTLEKREAVEAWAASVLSFAKCTLQAPTSFYRLTEVRSKGRLSPEN
jgi:hypothetical protein